MTKPLLHLSEKWPDPNSKPSLSLSKTHFPPTMSTPFPPSLPGGATTTPPPHVDTSSHSFSITIAMVIISFAVIAALCSYLVFKRLRSSSRTFSISDELVRRRCSESDGNLLVSLPLFTFGSVSGNLAGGDCAVCLSKFKKRDQLRLLPLCCHAFHRACIDAWIVSNQTCPLCRSTVFPSDSDILDKFSSPTVNRNTINNISSRDGNSGSFRVEIGSISRREGGAARRSYPIGSFQYIVDDNGYEVSAESTVSDHSSAHKDSSGGIPVPASQGEVLPAEFGGGRNWLREYADRLPFVPVFYRTVSLRNSGRFFSGSIRRSDPPVSAVDLEANRVGEEISEMFRWFSGF